MSGMGQVQTAHTKCNLSDRSFSQVESICYRLSEDRSRVLCHVDVSEKQTSATSNRITNVETRTAVAYPRQIFVKGILLVILRLIDSKFQEGIHKVLVIVKILVGLWRIP